MMTRTTNKTTIKNKNKSARSRILEFIFRHKGVTSSEIERRLKLPHTTVASSLNYFHNNGFITTSGEKFNKKTSRWQRIYISAITP